MSRIAALSPESDAEKSGAGEARLMEEAEFEAFHRRHSRALWAYLYRLCGDASVADDVFQKTFIRLLRTPVRSGEDLQLKAFLFRIATNLMIDHWRRARREKGWLSEFAGRDEGAAVDSAFGHDMQRLFDRLSPKERAMLWLAHVEGVEHETIGSIVGVEAKSVKVLLFRARRKLAGMLREAGLVPRDTAEAKEK